MPGHRPGAGGATWLCHPGDLHAPVRRQAGNQLAPVALPALHDRLSRAASFGADAGRRHAALHQRAAHGLGAALRQRLVVAGAADTVGIAGHPDRLHLCGFAYLRQDALHRLLPFRAQHRAVEAEQRVGRQPQRLFRQWCRCRCRRDRWPRRLQHGRARFRLPVTRLGDALAVKADLELAGEILRTLRGAEVEQVVPLAHAPHAFIEMRRAQQRVQLPLAHARREAAQVGDVRIDAFLQRGPGGLRELHGGGFDGTVGGRRMAAAGGQQAHPQDQAQRSGMLAGAGDAMLFHVIPPVDVSAMPGRGCGPAAGITTGCRHRRPRRPRHGCWWNH